MLGFPRSGSTLLDQILNAHPDIETLEEKPILETVEYGLGSEYPDALATLRNADIADLRAEYFSALDQHISGSRDLSKTYIDKLPLNTARVGLIHRLFPQAKIILSLRHPCDCCLSGFMQTFQPNPAMASFLSLERAAGLYAVTMGLWRQYTEVLPIDYHCVRYEDIVADFEAEARRIIDYLRLPWTDDILNYREKMKGRRIATPSYHQVNEPIYRRSIERWRNYEEQFEKVLPVLSPFIDYFGYEK
jgi:hypothetical protein